MGLDIVLHQEPGEEYVEVNARLCRTEDGRLVEESDPDARWLFCVPGQRIPRSEAEKYGLIESGQKAQPEESTPIELAKVSDIDSAKRWLDQAGGIEAVLEELDIVDDEARPVLAVLLLHGEADREKPRKGLIEALQERSA